MIFKFLYKILKKFNFH